MSWKRAVDRLARRPRRGGPRGHVERDMSWKRAVDRLARRPRRGGPRGHVERDMSWKRAVDRLARGSASAGPNAVRSAAKLQGGVRGLTRHASWMVAWSGGVVRVRDRRLG